MGIVHRDIKPANFFLTERSDGSDLLKILDFGISKVPPTLEGNLTATRTVMGTPSYMSPEQMKSSRQVDHRSDIWSLGIVLYELLQGQPPFQAETFTALVFKVATEPLSPLTVRIPDGLADIVYRCLEKDPGRRFQDVAELARALAPHAGSTTQATISVERTSRVLDNRAPRLSSNPGLPPTIRMPAEGAATAPPEQARRWPYVAGVLTVLGAVVAVVISASSGSDPREEQAAHEPGSASAAWPAEPAAPPQPPRVSTPPPAPLADAAIVIVPPDATPEPVSISGPLPSAPGPAQKPLPPAATRPPRPPSDDADDVLETRN
jgi:eukaryotic-like serine/threonine-protein kinase